jgi:hypothetical protein
MTGLRFLPVRDVPNLLLALTRHSEVAAERPSKSCTGASTASFEARFARTSG